MGIGSQEGPDWRGQGHRRGRPEGRESWEGPDQRGGGQTRGEGVTGGARPERTGRVFQAPKDSSSSGSHACKDGHRK